MSTPLATIPVGVIVERSKSANPWADFYWRAVSVLAGQPDTPAWTKLSGDGERTTFYAGTATVELYRTETGFYRDNLLSGAPGLWVALRAVDGDPPFTVSVVTADPAEGESLTETATDLVEQVPMPEAIQRVVAAFVAEHHVEQPFVKRKRDRANPEALRAAHARRRSRMSEPENFLTRWSRRKRVAEEPDQPAPAAAAAQETPAQMGKLAGEPDEEPTGKPAPAAAEAPAPAFDPASLPSLDSIGAQTDIRAFLQVGVPNDLKLAALRRAWSADPAISAFKGLAENDWDFTASNSMLGFGDIDPGTDVKKMLAQLFGETPRETEPPTAIPAQAEQLTPPPHDSEISQPPAIESAGNDDMVQRKENIAAREKDSELDEQADDAPVKRRRPQGGALPR